MAAGKKEVEKKKKSRVKRQDLSAGREGGPVHVESGLTPRQRKREVSHNTGIEQTQHNNSV